MSDTPMTRAEFERSSLVDSCNSVARNLGVPPLSAQEIAALYQRYLETLPQRARWIPDTCK